MKYLFFAPAIAAAAKWLTDLYNPSIMIYLVVPPELSSPHR